MAALDATGRIMFPRLIPCKRQGVHWVACADWSSKPGVLLAPGWRMRGALPADLQRQLNGGRQLLAQLRDAPPGFNASPEDQAALASSIRQLDEFFMLVVVGEFNAGKSAFINALVGRQVLKEGVTPTTAQIHILKYGDAITQSSDGQGIAVTTAPAELLREVQIVD